MVRDITVMLSVGKKPNYIVLITSPETDNCTISPAFDYTVRSKTPALYSNKFF